MNNQDFSRWREDFTARFPDSGEWLKRHPKTLALWFRELFTRAELADCLEANRRLMSEPIAAYERELIGPRVAQIARGIAYGRSDAANADWKANQKKRYTLSADEPGPAAEFRRMLASKVKHAPPDDEDAKSIDRHRQSVNQYLAENG